MGVLGCCQLRIMIGNNAFYHSVLIVNTLTTEGISGLDFLKEYKCAVDLGENMLRISQNCICIPLECSLNNDAVPTDKCNYVYIVKTICIPARSKLEILAKISIDISGKATWLLEGQHMKESPLVVVRALVRPCNNTVVDLATSQTLRAVLCLQCVTQPDTIHKGGQD